LAAEFFFWFLWAWAVFLLNVEARPLGWNEIFAWRFFALVFTRKKILQGCFFQAPCAPEKNVWICL